MASGHSGDNLGEQGESGGRPPFRELIQLPRLGGLCPSFIVGRYSGSLFCDGAVGGWIDLANVSRF